jgi:hypothetical protein
VPKQAKADVIGLSNGVLRQGLKTVDSSSDQKPGIHRNTKRRLIQAVVQLMQALLEKRPMFGDPLTAEMVAQLDFGLIADGLIHLHAILKREAIRYTQHSMVLNFNLKMEMLLRESPWARDLEMQVWESSHANGGTREH